MTRERLWLAVATITWRLLDALEKRSAHGSVKPPSVGLVLAGYDRDRTVASMLQAEQWAETYPAAVGMCLVLNRELSVPARWWTVMRGSNTAHEFSAYDEGIRQLRSMTAPDVWVLLNDRQGAYGGSGMRWLVPSVTRLVADCDVLAGHEDCLEVPVHRGTERVLGMYIRTNLLVVGARQLDGIGALVTHEVDDASRVLPPRWPLSPAEGHQVLSSQYLQIIRYWLTGLGPGNGSSWYRASADDQDLDRLRVKAMCILNEHELALSAKSPGLSVHDVRRVYRLVGLARNRTALKRELFRGHRVSLDSRRERLRLLLAASLTR